MIKTFLTPLALFFLVVGIFSCTKDNDPSDIDNIKPKVFAGLHREITLPIDTVYLSGNATDSDGVISAYLWSQVSGPMESVIENPGAPLTKVQFSKSGSYLFQLMAVDDGGATGVDTVSVLVKPSPIDSLTFQANPQDGYMDFTFAGNGTGGEFSSSNSPEIDATAWTSGGAAANQRAAILFNFSRLPANVTILSAKLDLYSDPTPLNGNLMDANYGTNNAFYIERVTSNWNMSSSWASQPTTTSVNQVLIPHTSLSQLDLIGVDVTNLVRDMLANTNYGFEIRLQSEVVYTSRIFCGVRYSNASKHPSLKIVYQVN
jgi:hypothetical protein